MAPLRAVTARVAQNVPVKDSTRAHNDRVLKVGNRNRPSSGANAMRCASVVAEAVASAERARSAENARSVENARNAENVTNTTAAVRKANSTRDRSAPPKPSRRTRPQYPVKQRSRSHRSMRNPRHANTVRAAAAEGAAVAIVRNIAQKRLPSIRALWARRIWSRPDPMRTRSSSTSQRRSRWTLSRRAELKKRRS
jgi:hypothetical protein